MSSKRCIIIPAYNEEKQIARVIKGIARYSDADIIVIDDGSTDKTYEHAVSAGVFVVRHPFNMGAGVAIQTGCKYATENNYDFLLQIDGDGQHHPAHIPDMFSSLEKGDADLIIGSRFLDYGGYKTGMLKSAGIWVFRRVIKMITGQNITDPTSGYRCMNRNILAYCISDNFPWDYPDADIIIDLHRMGFRIEEIPVKMLQNQEGRSMHRGFLRISFYIFKVFLSILAIILRRKSETKGG